MKPKRAGFPLIVGLTTTSVSGTSENFLAGIRSFFARLHESAPFGVIVAVDSTIGALATEIGRAAEEAGLRYQPLASRDTHEEPASTNQRLTAAEMELVEMSDLLLVPSSAKGSNNDQEESNLAVYASQVGRPIIRLDTETGKSDQERPGRIETQHGWLPELFEVAGLSSEADLETIKARMSAVADQAAPATRRLWKWILLLQGLVVLLPLLWLFRRQVQIAPWPIATMTFGAVILLVGISWWLRWRGMQKVWARARLVTEFARSRLAIAACVEMPGSPVFAVVPALRPLRWVPRRCEKEMSFTEWRDRYVHERIDDQLGYFSRKQKEAEGERKQLSRWTTLLLDIALAFAFAGLSIAFIPKIWMKNLGDARLEVILGLAGATMPLGLLLVQILRSVQEVNRRTARYAQQRQILEQARLRLMSLQSPELAMKLISDTEDQLLGEVMEWYFHAETSEYFFQFRRSETAPRGLRLKQADSRAGSQLGRAALAKGGMAGLFLLRVILGRVPWIVASAAAIVMWLNYYNPSQNGPSPELQRSVVIDWRPWNPSPERAENGCIILVHGLYGALSPSETGSDWQQTAWMKNCAEAIDRRLGARAPNTGLVDWSVPAQPSKYNRLSMGWGLADFVGDIAGVRPQAQEVGNVLADQLSQLIQQRVIRREQPLHLIGHSAGGFVVARAALRLAERGLAPEKTRVTILDTPGPDKELLFDLPKKCSTDFYISSPLGGLVPVQGLVKIAHKLVLSKPVQFSPEINLQLIQPATKMPIWDAHRYAYTWYIKTITDPDNAMCKGEGFNRSPILRPAPTGASP